MRCHRLFNHVGQGDTESGVSPLTETDTTALTQTSPDRALLGSD
jgi:hypothetical protein